MGMTATHITLFHYTSALHLPEIIDAGFIKTTESNASPRQHRAAPDVVWLTLTKRPTQKWQTMGEEFVTHDKGEIRFTVRVPIFAVDSWVSWCKKRKVPPFWQSALINSGGDDYRSWYVVERAVPRSEWVSVENTRTGELIWKKEH